LCKTRKRKRIYLIVLIFSRRAAANRDGQQTIKRPRNEKASILDSIEAVVAGRGFEPLTSGL
jgi:hypothetical protein